MLTTHDAFFSFLLAFLCRKTKETDPFLLLDFFIFDFFFFFFFQAEDGIRDTSVTGVQTCALPIWLLFTICILFTACVSMTSCWKTTAVEAQCAYNLEIMKWPKTIGLWKIGRTQQIGRASCRERV